MCGIGGVSLILGANVDVPMVLSGMQRIQHHSIIVALIVKVSVRMSDGVWVCATTAWLSSTSNPLGPADAYGGWALTYDRTVMSRKMLEVLTR